MAADTLRVDIPNKSRKKKNKSSHEHDLIKNEHMSTEEVEELTLENTEQNVDADQDSLRCIANDSDKKIIPSGDDKHSTVYVDENELASRPSPSPIGVSNHEASDAKQVSNDTNETPDKINERDSDDGDPILSGTGSVSKDCSASELVGWSELLPEWHTKLSERPKGLSNLVKNGIPEPLRGEVWQLLSGAHESSYLMDQYRLLLTRSAPTEQIILRDVHRTYPAHENFRSDSTSNSLLEALFKVCKAYAVYDEEVGYCQGLSFLVAALLLHMPEEQAFVVFVRIMRHYGLRDLFRNNFDELYLKFYQLEQLLADNMPDLHQHFVKVGIEPFTYASQWFLTVFTSKFPLNAVFYIMDIFLLDGMDTIFQVALSLLRDSKAELLSLDFEGILKYFRVQMPKRYRDQANVQQLIDSAGEISLKKLKKHAKSYETLKQKEKLMENPLIRLQGENAKLKENNLRLEQENDDLARELIASKIQLRAQLDMVEDHADTLSRALLGSQTDCKAHLATISDMEDERARLEVEVSQLKEVCRRELSRAETELARDSKIISDYKQICSRLSKRLDCKLRSIESFTGVIGDILRDNDSCAERTCHGLYDTRLSDFLRSLKLDDSDDQFGAHQHHQSQLEQSCDIETGSSQSNQSRRTSADSAESGDQRQVGALLKAKLECSATSSEVKIHQLTQHIDDLEVELARTKLALVEAECRCQQLTHEINTGVAVRVAPNQTSVGGVAAGLASKFGFSEILGKREATGREPSIKLHNQVTASEW